MRVSLNNIQFDIVNKLIKLQKDDKALSFGNDYICYQINASFNNISSALNHFHSSKKFYFLNKEGDTEFLAIGSWQEYTSLYNYEKIEEIVENNEFVKVCGAQRFKPEPDCLEWHGLEDCSFFIPKLIIEATDQGVVIKALLPNDFFDGELRKKEILHKFAISLDPNPNQSIEEYNHIKRNESVTSKTQWQKQVQRAINQIDKTDLTKVVLSRKVKVTYKNPVSAYEQFKMLKDNNSNNSYNIFYQFSITQSFYSVTPETLFKINNDKITIDSLAGTIKRGENKNEDELLAKQLLSNKKEIEEHRCVSNYIEDSLKDIGSEIEKTKNEEVLKLKYIQHIHSTYNAKLALGANRSSLITKLHPTPAVGGFPKTKSIDLISDIENSSRGFYASPIGYFSKNKTEFAVGLRCALADKNDLHIFAGCGIVKDSSPDKEWVETENKMKNFTQVIKAKSWKSFQ